MSKHYSLEPPQPRELLKQHTTHTEPLWTILHPQPERCFQPLSARVSFASFRLPELLIPQAKQSQLTHPHHSYTEPALLVPTREPAASIPPLLAQLSQPHLPSRKLCATSGPSHQVLQTRPFFPPSLNIITQCAKVNHSGLKVAF